MRTVLAIVVAALFSGLCPSGEGDSFVGREAMGYLLDDEMDQIALVFRETARERRPSEMIMLTRVEHDGATTMYLSRDDAERLIREMAPLVEWASRRQRFSRHIRVNAEVDVEAAFDRTMRLTFRSGRPRGEITYTGALAARVIEALHEATRADYHWMRELFSRRPPPPPPPHRSGPGAFRPERGGESFSVDDIRVEPIGLRSWTEITGRIRNHTGQSYQAAMFRITFLDHAGREVGTAQFSVTDFRPGAVADFHCTSKDNFRVWKDCRVEATSLIN